MSKVKVQEVCVLLRPPSLVCRWPPPAACSCGPLCAYVSTFLLERTSRDFKKALQESTSRKNFKKEPGTSLGVQWLRPHSSSAGGVDWILA